MPEVVPDRLLLGLDVGTSAIKGAVVDAAGTTRATRTVPTPFRRTADGSTQMSVADLLDAVDALLAALRPWLPGVAGVGVASLGESGGWVRDEAVADVPVLVWHDPGGRRTADHLVAALGQAELVRRTGRRARSWTSLSKIGWLAEQGVRPTGRWTGAAGLVVWHLTGAVAQEPSLAATSGAYDPVTGRYDDALVALAGVEVEWAPVLRAGVPAGSVTEPAAASTGLPLGVPVTVAGHDHPVGVVGAGGRPGMVTDSMGTGEPLIVAWEAGRPAPDVAGLPGHLTLTGWPGEDTLMLLWEHLRPGLGLGALVELLGRPRAELEREADGRAGRRPFPGGLLLALEDGEAGVEDLPAYARGDPVQAWADALDGYAAEAAVGEAVLRGLTGADRPTLLIGGGVRSPRWVRAKRDRLSHATVVAHEPDAVARGAALLAGVAAGWWPTVRSRV